MSIQEPQTPDNAAPPCTMNAFEAAVELSKNQIDWIDVRNEEELRVKTAISGFVFLLSFPEAKELVPAVTKFLDGEFNTTNHIRTYADLLRDTINVAAIEQKKATEFIINNDSTEHEIRIGYEHYLDVDVILCLVLFIMIHKPCCRLVKIAWLIPRLGENKLIIPLISYAAAAFAELINDPSNHYRPCCTAVGNSWLHRLAVYVMHHCSESKLPLPPDLTKLISLVSLPSSPSIKEGKATRMYDALSHPPQPVYVHEAPEGIAIGNQLAIELLGEMDANRQEEYYRRVERAVACYTGNITMNGVGPSIKKVQSASGLSWADAKSLVHSPHFSRLVFNYQCRYILALEHAKDCPDCQRVREEMEKRPHPGQQIRSSV